MRAVRIETVGGLDVLHYAELADEPPARGEVQVKVAAAGVNYIDLHHRTGRYPARLPMILGTEAAGIVEAVGSDASEFSVGDRVATVLPESARPISNETVNASSRLRPGAYAERMNVMGSQLVPVPAAVDIEAAAAVLLQGLTAHYLVNDSYRIGAGDVAVVHSVAGGVGLLLSQLCLRVGARVIGVTSSSEKAEVARSVGVDEVVLYSEGDFSARVRALTEGRGADVVYDAVGRDTFESSLNCLRPRGTMVLYGQASGPAPDLAPHSLNPRGSLALVVPGIAHHIEDRQEYRARASDILGLVADGELQVRIDRRFPLADADKAHAYMEARRTKGKVLLIP